MKEYFARAAALMTTIKMHSTNNGSRREAGEGRGGQGRAGT